MCLEMMFSWVLLDEWPPFGKELLTRLTVFSLCIMSICVPFWFREQGPVVQSIVSLTMSLRRQLVKFMWTTLSNMLLFFVGKM